MSKRLLLIVLFIFLPVAAAADEAPASLLGPQSTTPTGGSTTDSGALQPAGTGPQQSGSASASGLTAPSSVLQAPATSDTQLKVLAAEGDGPPHQTDESPDGFGLTLIGAAALVLLVCAVLVVLRDRKRFLESDPFRI